MKFLAKFAALVGAAAFLFSSFSVSPASAATKKKIVVVHAHTRVLKSGKVVHVKSFVRKTVKTGKMGKVVHVKGYTKVTKTGKMIHVKGYTRKAPKMHAMSKMHM